MERTLNKRFEEAKKDGVEAGFKRLAEYLMNECVLEVNSEEYQLAEIEFYYYDKENHPDVFVHCSKCQKDNNLFYFHNAGVDITFGNDNYYGGVLLRSIMNKNTGEIIIGSQNVAYSEFLKCNIKNGINISLNINNTKMDNEYLTSCRVGLYLNTKNFCKEENQDEEIDINMAKEFIFKPYRYILNDENLIKELLSNSNQEPTFLAWFIKNKNDNFYDNLIEKSNIKTQIDNLLKNVSDENQDKWKSANKSKEKERKEFINFISYF